METFWKALVAFVLLSAVLMSFRAEAETTIDELSDWEQALVVENGVVLYRFFKELMKDPSFENISAYCEGKEGNPLYKVIWLDRRDIEAMSDDELAEKALDVALLGYVKCDRMKNAS